MDVDMFCACGRRCRSLLLLLQPVAVNRRTHTQMFDRFWRLHAPRTLLIGAATDTHTSARRYLQQTSTSARAHARRARVRA